MENENSIELSGIFSDGYGINPKKLWKMKLDEHCGHGRGKYVKMVLSYLLSYTGAGNKEAWPSIATIAADLECGKDLIIEALQNSEKLKMIRKIKMFPNDPMRKNNKYILDFLDVDNSDLRVRQERITTAEGATFEVATIEPNNNTINKNKKNKGVDISLLSFTNELIKTAWIKWRDYKNEVHSDKYKSEKYEQIAVNNLETLCKGNYNNAMKIVDQSIINGWKGLFELKKIEQSQPRQPKPLN